MSHTRDTIIETTHIDVDQSQQPLLVETTDKPNSTNVFLQYINNSLQVNNVPVQTTVCSLKNISIRSLETMAIIVGSTTGLPYIKPARDFAGRYVFFGYCLGYGVSASLALVTTWALLDITNAMYGQTKEEKEIINKQYSLGKEVIYWSTTPLLGISAAFPVSYLMYKYNDHNLFLAGISIFTDSITNTCSLNEYYTEAKKMYPFYFGSYRIKSLERMRARLTYHLEKSRDILPNLSQSALQSILQHTQHNRVDERMLLFSLLDLARPQIDIEEKNNTWYHGLPKHIVNYSTIIFPTAWMIFSVMNSAESFKLLWDNVIFDWSISVTTSLPYLFLELMLAKAIFNQLYDLIIQNQFHTYNKSLGQNFYPKSYFVTTCLGLMTTCLAFGSRAKFVTDTIEGASGIALAVIVCISTVAYKSSAMLDIIKTIFEKISIRSSDSNHKEIAKLNLLIKRFINLIQNADRDKLEQFILDLSPDKLAHYFHQDSYLHPYDEEKGYTINSSINPKDAGSKNHCHDIQFEHSHETIKNENPTSTVSHWSLFSRSKHKQTADKLNMFSNTSPRCAII